MDDTKSCINLQHLLTAEHYDLVVKRIAQQVFWHISQSIPQEDLIQTGMIGLIKAIQQFNAQKGASFKTYASIRIKGHMLDEIRSLYTQQEYYSCISIDQIHCVATDASFDPEVIIDQEHQKNMLTNILYTLNNNEQIVMNLHYKLDKSVKEIASILNISSSRVSQINKKALHKLKLITKYE